ncbi:hypothetical protein HD806DRAFT_143598 [Xylariaceae sp. AK1471]|nr:hypothetical protein HD806DRAFT_143598 [Xylariaceae sp. AK1471]
MLWSQHPSRISKTFDLREVQGRGSMTDLGSTYVDVCAGADILVSLVRLPEAIVDDCHWVFANTTKGTGKFGPSIPSFVAYMNNGAESQLEFLD